MTILYTIMGIALAVMFIAAITNAVRSKSKKQPHRREPICEPINTFRPAVVSNKSNVQVGNFTSKTMTYRDLAKERMADNMKVLRDKMSSEEYEQKWGAQ